MSRLETEQSFLDPASLEGRERELIEAFANYQDTRYYGEAPLTSTPKRIVFPKVVRGVDLGGNRNDCH